MIPKKISGPFSEVPKIPTICMYISQEIPKYNGILRVESSSITFDGDSLSNPLKILLQDSFEGDFRVEYEIPQSYIPSPFNSSGRPYFVAPKSKYVYIPTERSIEDLWYNY